MGGFIWPMCICLAAFLMLASGEVKPDQPPYVYNMEDSETEDSSLDVNCTIYAIDLDMKKEIESITPDRLITYNIPRIGNWTPEYPLATWHWTRVKDGSGKTLLSMEYTYGLMSMTTLTYDLKTVEVKLDDDPPGCAAFLSNHQRNFKVMDLCIKDFNTSDEVINSDGVSMCHEVIVNKSGSAFFQNR